MAGRLFSHPSLQERKRPDDFDPYPHGFPREVIQLLRSCWAHDPRDRPGFPEASISSDAPPYPLRT